MNRTVNRVTLPCWYPSLRVTGSNFAPRKLSIASVAEAAGAAMTVNYAGCATTQHHVQAKTCARVTSCGEARQLLQERVRLHRQQGPRIGQAHRFAALLGSGENVRDGVVCHVPVRKRRRPVV